MSNIVTDTFLSFGEIINTIKDEVVRLGTTYPDTVYKKPAGHHFCSYVWGATPSGKGCIFGQALQNLGFPSDRLEFVESINDLLLSFYERQDPETLSFPDATLVSDFTTVQEFQDEGVPWGEAIRTLLK